MLNASDLGEVVYNWNGTNYTYYNNSLVLMYNFDNVSALGESDSIVVDASKHGNNGNVNNGKVNTTDCAYGNCFAFDGDNDRISTSADESLEMGTGDISITAYGGGRIQDDKKAAAGTIYKQTASQGDGAGDLIIDNNDLNTDYSAYVVTDLNGYESTSWRAVRRVWLRTSIAERRLSLVRLTPFSLFFVHFGFSADWLQAVAVQRVA